MTPEPRNPRYPRPSRAWPVLLLAAGAALFNTARAAEPPAGPAQQREIDALAAQLRAVQAQLRE
ncbi:MAG TPA: hypothetical protein VGR80_06715, partial [Steroidobacteraceae bacterium]|nr:hypothetical protein [Steroidobacteraceae bacterium]